MSSRRTLILIAAIVVGGLAAFAIFNYVGGIEDRAYDNAERVPVIRIAQDVPRGLDGATANAEGSFESAEIPEEFLPAGWHGLTAERIFAELHRLLSGPARQHAERLLGATGSSATA